jgi:Flp pilus assembly protein TadG
MERIADETRPADRGSVTVFAVIFTIGVIFLALMLADLGNIMNAKERAADTAEQAARAAADTLNQNELRVGNVVIDEGAACDAADNLVAQYSNVSGIDAVITNCQAPTLAQPRQATVTVEVKTTPIFSALIGSFTMSATASACAEFGITTGAAC